VTVRLSIRWRLTLWNTLTLALVLLGFAALIYALLRHALYAQVDRKLLVSLQELEQDTQLVSQLQDRLRHWIYEVHEHEGVFAVVYDPTGKVLDRTEELAEGSIPPVPILGADEHRLRDAVLPILGRQRLLEVSSQAGRQPLTVLLMAPLEEVDSQLARLMAALALAVPVALVVSGGLGYILARKALAPVDRLRRATREITAYHLDRRLPVANPSDELGGLAQTINEMIGRLERSFAEIRRFTADASHELRTPLTAIRAEAELALSRSLGAEDGQQLAGSILEECQRLTALTDQLLTLAREDAGVALPARKPLDLVALVRNVSETMRPLAESRGITLQAELDGSIQLLGDAPRLRQVFYNLLDNAIKFTPPGCAVTVRAVERGREAVVTVSDTGIGIPPEHLPRVFDRFYRVDTARSRQQGGTGLGLSIARSIIAAHGGRIGLESTPEKGTTCTVTLPVSERSERCDG
jgi:heavy metal sensor kinase